MQFPPGNTPTGRPPQEFLHEMNSSGGLTNLLDRPMSIKGVSADVPRSAVCPNASPIRVIVPAYVFSGTIIVHRTDIIYLSYTALPAFGCEFKTSEGNNQHGLPAYSESTLIGTHALGQPPRPTRTRRVDDD